MKQIFSVMFDAEEVVEVGQIGVPLMNALHIKAIDIERVCPTQRAVDCALCHCQTVIIRDGVHCINCGRVYKSHSH